jgi:DTW domain-containing protein YfiP
MARDHCLDCDRPRRTCLCAAYKTVPENVRGLSGLVLVLQHPKEKRCDFVNALATTDVQAGSNMEKGLHSMQAKTGHSTRVAEGFAACESALWTPLSGVLLF